MKSVILSMLLVGMQAMANEGVRMIENESTFSFSSHRAYYSCDYAESQAKKHIRAMGGEVMSARCIGGLPDSPFLSVTVAYKQFVTSTSVDSAAGTWKAVTIKGRESCEFNKKMIESFLPKFETRNLSARENCFYSEGRYQYSFETLVAAE